MSDYGVLSRVFHRLVLGSAAIAEATFDIESSLHQKKAADQSQEHHVFVAGLARAGTTILMRSLYESGEFGSLTYRDMPLVLSPNLWASLSRFNGRHKDATERAHGDGLKVNYDSPEALEEIFWRVFHDDLYLEKTRLTPMSLTDNDDLERYQRYINLILHHCQKRRYLSKNNNNILRLPTIQAAFPNSTILVPYRHPAQQAASLLSQHRMFIEKHQSDKFTADYMTWLAHHEFGPNHRPFLFADDTVQARPVPTSTTPDNIDYWIIQWNTVYSALLDQDEKKPLNTLFVGYEKLCESSALQSAVKSTTRCPGIDFSSLRAAFPKKIDGIDPDLLQESLVLYDRLEARCNEMSTATSEKS